MKPNFLRPTTEKRVTPNDFLKLQREQKDNIQSVDIVPPKLGQFDFGGMLEHVNFGSLIVRFKTPILEQRSCRTK